MDIFVPEDQLLLPVSSQNPVGLSLLQNLDEAGDYDSLKNRRESCAAKEDENERRTRMMISCLSED
jgi:hypothetical protein